MTPEQEQFRLAVDAILHRFHVCSDPYEREWYAQEVARIDNGAARQSLADMADNSWPEKETA